MAGFGQYLKDTRGELRHVAWPTQMQTIVYTILVIAVSIGVALYLGLFDYIFTGALARFLDVEQGTGAPLIVDQVETDTGSAPEFSITPTE